MIVFGVKSWTQDHYDMIISQATLNIIAIVFVVVAVAVMILGVIFRRQIKACCEKCCNKNFPRVAKHVDWKNLTIVPAAAPAPADQRVTSETAETAVGSNNK
jgi:hypothetical protein